MKKTIVFRVKEKYQSQNFRFTTPPKGGAENNGYTFI
jgi:hypothetical protein